MLILNIVVHHIVRTIICHASSRFFWLLEMSKLESNADFHREIERRFKLTAVRSGVNPGEMCVCDTLFSQYLSLILCSSSPPPFYVNLRRWRFVCLWTTASRLTVYWVSSQNVLRPKRPWLLRSKRPQLLRLKCLCLVTLFVMMVFLLAFCIRTWWTTRKE